MFVTVWVTMEQDICGIIHNVRILVNHYDRNNSTHNTMMSSSPGVTTAHAHPLLPAVTNTGPRSLADRIIQ